MEENHERQFTGVFVPALVWENKELSWLEKCLWAELRALDKPGVGCYASNAYLAKMMDSSAASIANMLCRLRKAGLIYTRKFDGTTRWLSCIENPDLTPKLRQGSPLSEGSINPQVKQRVVVETIDENGGRKKGRSTETVTAQDLANYVFPPPLNTPAFTAALERWRVHKARRGEYLTRYMVELLIKDKDCGKLGHDGAIAAIDYSISKNYQGVYPPKAVTVNGKQEKGIGFSPKPTQGYDPGRKATDEELQSQADALRKTREAIKRGQKIE